MSDIVSRLQATCPRCGLTLPHAFNRDGYPGVATRHMTGWKPGDGPIARCACKESPDA